MRNWAYAVAAGDELKDMWSVDDFVNGHYHLRIYGPNGFFRQFSGDKNHPLVDVKMRYEQNNSKPTGNIVLQINNRTKQSQGIIIVDNSYKAGSKAETIDPSTSKEITLDTGRSYGWYDFSINLKGKSSLTRRYAGRVETGMVSKTDPLMGMIV
jgi:phospholipase C